MIITKFSRFGQVVKNENGEVIPGSFRFTAFLPDGKEVGFKAAQSQIAGAAISIEKSVFTDKTGKVVEFYKLMQAFPNAEAIKDQVVAIQSIRSLDAAVAAMF